MSEEKRKIFEAELTAYFRLKFDSQQNMKFLKTDSTIKISKTKINSASAEISFGHCSRGQAYALHMSVYSPELLDFFKQINPPYKSNKPQGVTYAMNSQMETGFKSFAPNMMGNVPLPRNETEREKTCEWIYTKVRDIYLPRAMNLIELKPETVQDVLLFPYYYAFPFLTILYVLKKNNIRLPEKEMADIMRRNKGHIVRRVILNKQFDKELLHRYLNGELE